jgi:hypothetical protein
VTGIYTGVQPDLSAVLADAGAAVQRRVAQGLVEIVAERVPVDGGRQTLHALKTQQFGDTDLRRWLRLQAQSSDDRSQLLEQQKDDALEDAAGWTTEQEAELVATSQASGAYRTLTAALDLDPAQAAQRTAYEARFATSDREADTVVALVLIDNNVDAARVRRVAHWLD